MAENPILTPAPAPNMSASADAGGADAGGAGAGAGAGASSDAASHAGQFSGGSPVAGAALSPAMRAVPGMPAVRDGAATLTGERVARLIERLFWEADQAVSPELAAMPFEESERLMFSRSGYREFYRRARNLWMPVARETGVLLYQLARSMGANNIVEFGTSFGLSTLYLASALRDNGGGRLIGSEFEPAKVARARAHLEEGGLADLVDIREGDALVTLAADLPEWIDLVLLDGAKPIYCDVLDLLEGHLRPGALIVADNADYSPEYVMRVRSVANGYLSVPFGEDVELSIWVG